MSFRFRLDETIEAGFRRITKEQIAKAHWYLAFSDDPAKSVFEARKCMKRLRALLHLCRPALGKSDFAFENARYRDIARLLSPSRDREVMIQTIALLIADIKSGKKSKTTKIACKGLSSLRASLVRDVGTDGRGFEDVRRAAASRRHAITMLDEAQQELGQLRLKGHGFKAVRRGLEKSFERGAVAFLKAQKSDSDEVLHDWRKHVQTHRRHMVLFNKFWPEFFGFRVASTKVLSDILGLHRDLGLVGDLARAQPSSVLTPKVGRIVRKQIRKRQTVLRRGAFDKACKLFADDPKDLAFQVERYWKVSYHAEPLSKRAAGGPKSRSKRRASADKANPFKLSDGI